MCPDTPRPRATGESTRRFTNTPRNPRGCSDGCSAVWVDEEQVSARAGGDKAEESERRGRMDDETCCF